VSATTPASIITGVDFVSVPTKDFEAARAFYADVLGLEPSKVWGRPGQEPMGAEFETGTVTLALLNNSRLGLDFSPNGAPIEFHVDDFEAARAELESRGVQFQGDTLDSGVCFQAFFTDPDGNALAIHHRYAPPAAAG
jgi:catechol 2,3-dioxygenase-like lactoylglutathione lyase family enzyme